MTKGKVSLIAELFVKNKMQLKCTGCGRAIELTINDDGYIYLPTGALRFSCPHCEEIYELDYDIKSIKE